MASKGYASPKARTLVLAIAMAWLSPVLADTGMASMHDRAPAAEAAPSASLAAYTHDNAAAMDRMMQGMDAPSTGNVDQDFVQAMTAHHQGAIDMAVAMLKYGHDEQLKRIAQEIIVDQQQEIAAMRLALGQPLPPRTEAPTQMPVSRN
ncbi:DUF305 domain-containing protein [Pseudomonas massiliensis]|uniref:DUF305 domain-containing protein n=1 Tax=Pseudomonas massiliensis TaxID=522492 RepID=UPI000A05C769|nr:DUF305 domain-containing protein [Pseudomonas massiliensis]